MNPRHLSVLLLLSASFITACNLFGGLSKPSNDEQYLVAARACLDRGDYACALENYQGLSDSKADVKWSELSLTTLAQNGIFSFSDLISSLGSARGNGATLTSMGNLLASRGKINLAARQVIRETYLQNDKISSAELKAFSKFISALSMFNSILGNVAGADNVLTAGDIVVSPAGCSTTSCAGVPACAAKTSAIKNFTATPPIILKNSLNDDLADPTFWTDSETSLHMLLSSANIALTHINQFTSNGNEGIFDVINSLLQFLTSSGLSDPAQLSDCMRAQLIETLGL